MILKGKMLDTNKVLGYFYEIEGRVVKGEQLGRELGFPTANVHYLNTITVSYTHLTLPTSDLV